jgi:flagellar basal-body rod modification protein FlgD
MTITSNSSTPPATDASGPATLRVPKQTLGQEDFLKLITVQLTKQDPLKPTDDTSFMAQMAQFTTLEQSSQMARDMAALRSDLNFQSASSLIGREVTVETEDGPVTGLVDAIDSSGGTVRLSVGGSFYPLSGVVRVAPAPVPAPAPQP